LGATKVAIPEVTVTWEKIQARLGTSATSSAGRKEACSLNSAIRVTDVRSEDLEMLRGSATRTEVADGSDEADEPVDPEQGPGVVADGLDDAEVNDIGAGPLPADSIAPAPIAKVAVRRRSHTGQAATNRGEYERQRTRESKISTSCIGHEREKHDWWPVGTELIGRIGSETFTATVMENAQVKSGRSLLITSGPANGRICITPTRAAMEATEACRQSHNLGRGGGVTNGWDFWKPRT
jgi:hypothetical protein